LGADFHLDLGMGVMMMMVSFLSYPVEDIGGGEVDNTEYYKLLEV
jgi:hypothetical protein